MSNQCAHPSCTQEGTFSAPCDPNDLRKRQFFCAEHIREFNKKWNGLEGLNSGEIYNLQDGASTWNRPTWKMGLNSMSSNAANFEFDRAEDLFAFFKARRDDEGHAKGRTRPSSPSHMPPDVKEACIILSVEPPFNESTLKKRYINMLKQHHPDVNDSSEEAEDFSKKINVAYQILTDFIERTDSLF